MRRVHIRQRPFDLPAQRRHAAWRVLTTLTLMLASASDFAWGDRMPDAFAQADAGVPSPPGLAAPADGTTVADAWGGVELQWDPVPGATEYQVILNDGDQILLGKFQLQFRKTLDEQVVLDEEKPMLEEAGTVIRSGPFDRIFTAVSLPEIELTKRDAMQFTIPARTMRFHEACASPALLKTATRESTFVIPSALANARPAVRAGSWTRGPS